MWQPFFLSLELAFWTTLILTFIVIPLAYWVAFSRSPLRLPVHVVALLPMVLPPTVLGFYLLIMLGPQGPVGQLVQQSGLGSLPFTFTGLLIGSVVYSLPFYLQPVVSFFQSLGPRPFEVASTLGAGPFDRFFTVALPLARNGLFAGALLSFVHTLGEFGVVLMLGGSIPGQTKVISVAIYQHVEALEYQQAHLLSGGLLIFCFAVLCLLLAKRRGVGV